MESFACLMYHNVVGDGSLSGPSPEWSALSPSILSYFVEERAFAEQIAAMKSAVKLVTLQQVRDFYAVAEVARLPTELLRLPIHMAEESNRDYAVGTFPPPSRIVGKVWPPESIL